MGAVFFKKAEFSLDCQCKSMGNVCCLGRYDHYRKKYEQIESKIIDNLVSYGPISDALGLDDGSSDIAKFDTAFENGDIPTLVELCYSNTPTRDSKFKVHPWAAHPETIGALSAIQLGFYASKEYQPEYKEDIRLAGGIEVLSDLLKSNEDDRVHAAAITLSFLSSGNPKCCEEMYENDLFPYLINGMRSTLDPFRATCAQICRNIYHQDVNYRKEFMRSGGLVALVSLLDPIDDSDELYLTQLDAIYHLDDFIMDGIEEIPELVTYVKASGALPKLQLLEKGNIKELSVAAKSLAIRLLD